MALEVGSEAPDFTLVDSNGDEVTLSQFRGTPVYLNFFPAAFSGVCTPWFTSIVNNADSVEGAVVIGVSVDNKASLKAFRESLGAEGVHFLADFHPKGAVAQAYDCYLDQAGVAGRCTYVIDGAGMIIDVDQVVTLETPDADRLLASLATCKV